jgi:hypothetical protein
VQLRLDLDRTIWRSLQLELLLLLLLLLLLNRGSLPGTPWGTADASLAATFVTIPLEWAPSYLTAVATPIPRICMILAVHGAGEHSGSAEASTYAPTYRTSRVPTPKPD